MIFYLGTDRVSWLSFTDYPLFVSRRVLYKRKKFPRAKMSWALDSGSFSELSLNGKWDLTAKQYALEVNRFSQEIGNLEWVSIQDYMCEPFIIKKTGLTVKIHQEKTIENFIELCSINPFIPWVPILQGFKFDDYLEHISMYQKRGINLSDFSIVGIGSICRRQSTREAETIIKRISQEHIKLHGFGFKTKGLENVAMALRSSDSMAWSYQARFIPPMKNHTHKNCSHCYDYAKQWRSKLIEIINRVSNYPYQLSLI